LKKACPDPCRSMSALRGRPLFAKLRKGDVVIAPKLDRLFRSALDALQVVEDLRKRGVSLHLLDLGGDISGNGLSKLFLTIAAAFAEAERDRIRERIGQVKADQKARGRYLGGIVPFGYRRGEHGQLAPHEAEQGGHPRDGCSEGSGKGAAGHRRGDAGQGLQNQPRGCEGRPSGSQPLRVIARSSSPTYPLYFRGTVVRDGLA
jgi:Resolvase, N terminal domain